MSLVNLMLQESFAQSYLNKQTSFSFNLWYEFKVAGRKVACYVLTRIVVKLLVLSIHFYNLILCLPTHHPPTHLKFWLIRPNNKHI